MGGGHEHRTRYKLAQGDGEGLGLRDRCCRQCCSGLAGWLVERSKGRCEQRRQHTWLQLGVFLLSSHPLNSTKSSFLSKLRIARCEYQLLPGEEHICRHSKANCGDVRGV